MAEYGATAPGLGEEVVAATPAPSDHKNRSWARAIGVAVSLLAVLGIATRSSAIVPSITTNLDESGSSPPPETESSTALSFKVENYYTQRDGAVGMGYPWISAYMVAEPYRQSTFQVVGASAHHSYSWEISGPSGAIEMGFGENFTYTTTVPGKYHVTLYEKDAPTRSGTVQSVSAYVQSRYVRRELRTLTPADRDTFFSACEIVYKTGCDEGKKKYGAGFECIDSLVQTHNELAGAKYCDHMHDGYGFLTNHVALSNWFETVLQSVNPSIALPYWDYSKEGQLVNKTGEIRLWRQSQVFDNDQFGPAAINGMLTEGLFAFTKTQYNARNVTNTANAYNYMRAPWNQNKNPYVTRYNTTYGFDFSAVPGCYDHKNALEFTKFSDFGSNIMYGPHGTTHMMIGGIGNADFKNALKSLDYDMEMAMRWGPTAFAIQKNMWRKGYLECPSTCSLDTPMDECKCICPNLTAWHHVSETDLWNDLLQKVFSEDYDRVLDRSGNFIGVDLMKILCNDYDTMAPNMGDSLESASPNDISFWPTHPTVERLFVWRRLNTFTDDTWLDNQAWSVKGFLIDYCWGHNWDDVLSWPNHIFPGFSGPFTNADIWNITDPAHDHTSYIYDSFLWPHCVEDGYLETLIETDLTVSA